MFRQRQPCGHDAGHVRIAGKCRSRIGHHGGLIQRHGRGQGAVRARIRFFSLLCQSFVGFRLAAIATCVNWGLWFPHSWFESRRGSKPQVLCSMDLRLLYSTTTVDFRGLSGANRVVFIERIPAPNTVRPRQVSRKLCRPTVFAAPCSTNPRRPESQARWQPRGPDACSIRSTTDWLHIRRGNPSWPILKQA